MADEQLRANRQATIEVLSPLHVGGGEGNLRLDFDFAFERGVVWVMDQEKVAERLTDEQLRHGVPDVRLSRILRPKDYPSCTAYSLGVAGTVASEIVPFIKDVWGHPYLPGSSVKGALRTCVAWAAAREGGGGVVPGQLGPNPKYAGSGWERGVFGASPNYDLMRSLLVDDAGSVPLEQMELASVSIYSLRGADLQPKGQGFRFSVEVLRSGTQLECRIGIDRYALSHPALRFSERGAWIDGLQQLCRVRASQLIAEEKAFYSRCRVRPLQQFYERLERVASDLGPGQFLLQMAWGTGWKAKTLGPALSEAPFFDEIRDRYRLGRPRAPFPKSRRVVERGGTPSEPLGWVKVTL